jgi:hypothetical protein
MRKKNKASEEAGDDLRELFRIFSELLAQLKKSKQHESPYYDSADIKRMLNISDSTLHRIRKSEKIPYFRIGRKIFYPKSVFNEDFRNAFRK